MEVKPYFTLVDIHYTNSFLTYCHLSTCYLRFEINNNTIQLKMIEQYPLDGVIFYITLRCDIMYQ